MLGNLSSLHNSIFLSVRWIAVLICFFANWQLSAQTAIRSQHFIFYSTPQNLRAAEQGLQRLEELRAAIQALHGKQWVSTSPLRIWMPANEAAWNKFTTTNAEQGIFVSGQSQDWVVVNPGSQSFLEVLSHEYIHAVLHRALPNLPTWFEEGICEYYSNLLLRRKGNRFVAVVGQPPTRHRRILEDLPSIDIDQLASEPITINTYAPAWAIAYHLWPSYKAGDKFPSKLSIGPFSPRTIPLDYISPAKTQSLLSRKEVNELEIEFRNQFPSSNQPIEAAVSLAESTFLEGLRLSDFGQTGPAILLLEKACALRPSNSSWWNALALAYQENKQFPEARIAIEKALATAKNETETAAARSLQKALN